MAETRFTVRQPAAGRVVVVVEGDLDFAASLRLRLVLYDGVDSGCRDLVVDLSGVRLIDASVVGVLLRVLRHLAERNGGLRVVGATGRVLEVLQITNAAGPLRALEPYEALDQDVPDDEGARTEVDQDRWRNPWGFEVSELLYARSQLPPDDPRRAQLRKRAIEIALPHAHRLARRFHGMGEPAADLAQIAALGLLKAIDGFDARIGADFGAYASPTVLGELKRYFRDRGWGVHVPRRLQELRLEINRAREELARHLGRSPTPADLAEYLEISEREVVEAMVAAGGYRPVSLDAPLGPDDTSTALDRLGTHDAELDSVEFRESVHPLLARLPLRESKIICMRFYGNMSQSQIAKELGISQMHVSRLLNRILANLRTALLAEC